MGVALWWAQGQVQPLIAAGPFLLRTTVVLVLIGLASIVHFAVVFLAGGMRLADLRGMARRG